MSRVQNRVTRLNSVRTSKAKRLTRKQSKINVKKRHRVSLWLMKLKRRSDEKREAIRRFCLFRDRIGSDRGLTLEFYAFN